MSDVELPPQTAPENIGVSLRGFADEPSAQKFGHLIADTVRSLSHYMDLGRLDGITVAYDYDDALARLDRGYTPSVLLSRTDTEEISGVAMAPAVLRDGVVKAHLVFCAPYVLGLEADPASDEFASALYTVAHECGHVHDLSERDQSMPNIILQQRITDCEEKTLEPVALSLWEEYAACRLSAIFGRNQTGRLEQGLTSVLAVARDNSNAAIREYRLHADVNRVLAEAGLHICRPLKISAYLLGHLDGLELTLDDIPETRDAVRSSAYATFIERSHEGLRDLWTKQGRWASYKELGTLKQIVKELYADSGLFLEPKPDGGMHVRIPFTPATMPA